ncbi:purine-cytosine permease family protein [Luedemannella helvata]|uniref:Allantoin permease n=1 Tax=Luedemannella helvata TaxID=349315 RepID=A0ABN2K2Q0_9ACTN
MAQTIPLPTLDTADHDDPKVVAEQRADDYSTHVVPFSARVGRWQLTMSFWSLLSAMVWLFYGALVASLYGTTNALIAIVLSVIVYSIVNALFASWGLRSGLNSTLLSRRMFGVVGASLTALLIAANTTYYAVFESSTLAVAFQTYFEAGDIKIWYLVVVVAMLPLMLGSVQTWMAKLNAILLPLYAVGIVAAVIVAAVKYDNNDWWSFPGIVPDVARSYPGWVLGFVLYMGIWLLMPSTVDFARFAKKQDETFHNVVTFGPVFYTWLFLANGLAGIFLVRAVLPNEPAAEIGVVRAVLATLGFVGLVIIVASQARINSVNYYLASANWERLVTGLTGLRIPRLVWVVIVSAAVYLLMLTDVFSYLQTALNWQGVLLVGWVAVVLTHFVIVPEDRRKGAEFRARRLPKVTWGLLAWLIASGIGIYLIEVDSAPAKLAGISQIVVFVVAAGLYAACTKLLPSPLRDRGPDVRNEVDDPWGKRVRCHACRHSYVAQEMDRDARAGNAPICDACAT